MLTVSEAFPCNRPLLVRVCDCVFRAEPTSTPLLVSSGALRAERRGTAFPAVGELFTGVQGEDVSGSLCSVKLCVLHIHADTVALRLRSGRGLQTVAFTDTVLPALVSPCQRGRRAVQHEGYRHCA